MTPSPSGLQSTPDHDPAGTRTNPRLYPDSIQHDLNAVDLPQRTKDEILTCAYQYTRCIIPHHTNSRRYLAFMRTVIIGTVAEFRGDLVDITMGDGDVLGYSLGGIMEELFGGTGFEEDMSREFRTFLLFTADKTCPRRHGELYRRYRIALAQSPAQWFRLRDADALVRFSIAAALACNDRAIAGWAGRFEVMAEVAVTLYDAVAFHKHMAEGEVCTTFAYVPARSRTQAFGRARDVLWALDAVGADEEDTRVVLNLVRALGGPIHMMMHRYRFVEEDLTIGRPGDDGVRDLAKRKAKLWFRDDDDGGEGLVEGWQRYEFVMSRHKQFLFSGLEQILAESGSAVCFQCRQMVLANERGVGLCKGCERVWREYLEELPARVVAAFHGSKVGNLARSDEDV